MTHYEHRQPKYQFGRVSYSPFLNIESLFSQTFGQFSDSYKTRLKLDEKETEYTLTLELPGYSQKDLEVTIENEILTIKATNESKGETKRELILWDDVDYEKVGGKIENGILTVKLPKIEKAKPKKIKID